MANLGELSSSMSFTSSSYISNDSSSHNMCAFTSPETTSSPDIISLNKLSSNLEQLLVDSDYDYSDAYFVVEGIHVGVQKCILAARSGFFHEYFKKEKGSSEKDGKPNYLMADLLPHGHVGYEAFLVFLSYLYTGKLKPSPPEVSTCVDTLCAHDACRPAINFVVELMYAASTFQVPELVSVFQRRLLNFVDKALIEDVIPILLVASRCQSSQLISQCINRVARSNLEEISLEKELPYEVVEDIKLLRHTSQADDEDTVLVNPARAKTTRAMHKALDFDDVELVTRLLDESDTTLDDAFALHYAAAYSDPKVVSEILSLGRGNVNLVNPRGYSVLHVAAMRMEPSIIISLLTNGACVSEVTSDEQSAVSICRRLTRPKDYHKKAEEGKETNKARMCIDVLEREMRMNPIPADSANSSPLIADDLHLQLLHLENRVAFARLLFPSEAKVAMQLAQADMTCEFSGHMTSKSSNGNFREVDLNETPVMKNKRLSLRVEALAKTVKLGQRFFPHCSQALDRFMDDDLRDFLFLEDGTPVEQKAKRMRFMELKKDLQKAFNKDKAEQRRAGLHSSTSSSSLSSSLSCLIDGPHYKPKKV